MIPDWMVVFFPAIGVLITQLIRLYEPAGAFGARNIGAVVALFLAGLATAVTGVDLPSFPAYAGDVSAFFVALGAWAGVVWAIWLAFWKLEQAIYDALVGQLKLPD